MYFDFDKFDQIEKPSITLCNPDRTIMHSISSIIHDTKLSLRYNALSEFSFTIGRFFDDGVTVSPAYNFIEPKKVIYIQNALKIDSPTGDSDSMYFIISNVEENFNGLTPVKKVTCQSAEAELIYKQLVNFSGTSVKFYDLLNPENTCLDSILKDTNWSVGYVDPQLINLYRSPTITNSTIYNALMTTIEQAYGCVFIFDTVYRYVHAYSINSNTENEHSTNDTTRKSDIFISFDNLIKTAKFKKITDEIATCLRCYGGSGLTIRDVNPLGTDKIYDFGYFKTTEWMGQDLIDAITAWENSIESQQIYYSGLLVDYKNLNVYLSKLEVDRTFLYDNDADSKVKDVHGVLLGIGLNELLEIQKIRMSANPPQTLGDIPAKIKAKRVQLSANRAEITNYKNQIRNKLLTIQDVNESLSFENNFTSEQIHNLRNFIIENSYMNNNIIITDIMTPAEVQDQSQQLYDAAKKVIALRSTPRYEFEADLVNLLALSEFLKFAEMFDLGMAVKVSLRDDLLIEAIILQIDVSFDKLDDLKVIFSNQLRLDNGIYRYSDLIDQINNTSNFVNDNTQNLLDWSNNHKSDVTDFISSALDTTKNMLINSSDQEITMGKYGLQGKRKIDTDANGDPIYDLNQVWLTSQTLAFSNDGFDTVKLALGQIYRTDANGAVKLAGYGLAADMVLGNLIFGSNLRISNASGSFNFDENGAILTDANFIINKSGTNNKGKILLNPYDGIRITNKDGNTVFNADSNGNLTLTGTINAKEGGTIGGWNIDSDGISKGSNLYIRSTGDLKIGPLTISGNNGDFSGTFHADKLIGQISGGSGGQIKQNTIDNYNIKSLSAEKINVGVLKGVDVFGGKISYGNTYEDPQVQMYAIGNTQAILRAKESIQIYVKDYFSSNFNDIGSEILINPDSITLACVSGSSSDLNGTINIGTRSNNPSIGNIIKLNGVNLDLTNLTNITLDSNFNQTGYSGTISVGTVTLYFGMGICYGYV